MATTFLLDPRVLDDKVLETVPVQEIVADAFAYFQDGENLQPSYVFYIDSFDNRAPNDTFLRAVDVSSSRYDGHHGDLSLCFQKANVIFMPLSDGEKFQWGFESKEKRETYLRACSVLYIGGEFKKADAENLKRYGVSIKP